MVQPMVKKRILLCRMVRDKPDKPVEQSPKDKCAAETQSQHPEEPVGPEQNPEHVGPACQELKERQLESVHWNNGDEDPEPWLQLVTGGGADCLPTHLRPFSSHAEYKLVKSTYLQLRQSGYYWGPMTMEEAHEILTHSLLGTFLIRDSGQPDVFFTLSYQSEDGPTSVRVQLNDLLFSLQGSQKKYPSLFALLTYYTSSSCKLTVPYRRQRPESLRQTCRRAFVRTYGAENIGSLPGLSRQVRNYLHAYPHCT
ncbi:suppressor of cytokine signaling 1-like [Hippoglossus stenolepis]|uniref:suppressor of cytokine signaling 1-like n=1 Tax=Hippoglossus stenolepis TaxID=195615 RepID=UPI001FAFDCCE|nr:suppressor of cytokine signaling 1-like [Hippoglossus stenolepis]